MAPSYLPARFLALCLAILGVSALNFDVSGEAITQRFWDCCKPSCAWKYKADVNQPVQACTKDGKADGVDAGTGCNGGSAFQCSEQQPWAVNDTFSYGFAGAHIVPELVGGKLEDGWCCACYRLDFTSDPLQGKSMIIQASNTAYDVMDKNLFVLSVPGGNHSTTDACNLQYGVEQSVFGENGVGLGARGACDKMPEPLRSGCEWRFDWFKDADYTTAKFQRVTCPTELTDKTKCIRKDDVPGEKSTEKPGTGTTLSPGLSAIIGFAGLAFGVFLSI